MFFPGKIFVLPLTGSTLLVLYSEVRLLILTKLTGLKFRLCFQAPESHLLYEQQIKVIVLILVSMNRIPQNKLIKTVITESLFSFFFSCRKENERHKWTADVDLHVKEYKSGENCTNCITENRLYRQICTFVIKLIKKEEIKIICLRCAVILNLASEGELLGSAHMHLTLALLSAIGTYKTTGFVLCPLRGPQRGKWTSGEEISKKAYC